MEKEKEVDMREGGEEGDKTGETFRSDEGY